MRRIAVDVAWNRAAVWSFLAIGRLSAALRRHWKRVLLGAFVGWILASVVGAVALVALEILGLVSRETSDALGIVVVLGGVGLGALIAYALKPTPPGASSHRGHPAA
jgi:hypothetical protein